MAGPFVTDHLQVNALNGIRKLKKKRGKFSRQTDVPQFRELSSSLSTKSGLLKVEFPSEKQKGLAWPLIVSNI